MQERSFDKYYVTSLQSCWNICIWVWVWVCFRGVLSFLRVEVWLFRDDCNNCWEQCKVCTWIFRQLSLTAQENRLHQWIPRPRKYKKLVWLCSCGSVKSCFKDFFASECTGSNVRSRKPWSIKTHSHSKERSFSSSDVTFKCFFMFVGAGG